MNPIIKAIIIGLAIVIPLTLVLNLTNASQAVIAPVMLLAFGVSSLITLKLYVDWKDEQAKLPRD